MNEVKSTDSASETKTTANKQETKSSSNNNNRNLWKKAKERHRMKARYVIKNRLVALNINTAQKYTTEDNYIENDNSFDDDDDDDNDNNNSCLKTKDIENASELKPFVKAIEEANSSYFGIHKLVSLTPNLLNSTFNNKCTTSSEHNNFINEERVKLLTTSRFGEAYATSLKFFLNHEINGVSLVSYSAYLGEYRILSMLLISLADPTNTSSSSSFCYDDDNISSTRRKKQQEQHQRRLKNTAKILQTFCTASFPLTLYCGIVRRVCEMRLAGFLYYIIDNDSNHDLNNNEQKQHHSCTLCSDNIPDKLLLRNYKSNSNNNHEEKQQCYHLFCEDCLWEDILSNYLYRQGDIVICPVCATTTTTSNTLQQQQYQALLFHNNTNNENNNHQNDDFNDTTTTPQQRGQISLLKYKQLPLISSQLKNMKNGTSKKRNAISYNWNTAIFSHQNKIGQSQDVRSDKLFFYTSQGDKKTAYHYIHACILSGVDIDVVASEYNQTCLYLACWRGYTDVVSLLLYYGANPCIISNGYSSAINVAKRYQHKDIISLLEHYNNTATNSFNKEKMENGEECLLQPIMQMKDLFFPSTTIKPTLNYLIDPNTNHPGKGSCTIDNILPETILLKVDSLFQSLPLQINQREKKKNNQQDIINSCADRYYYCDTEGHLCNNISNSILQAFQQQHQESSSSIDDVIVVVFPHVRFLNYTKAGSFLPPHVDLFRTCDSFPIEQYIIAKQGSTMSQQQQESLLLQQHNSSTHSFLLYLTDCNNGGCTSLLSSLPSCSSSSKSSNDNNKDNDDVDILAKVQPKRGRLLLFPHLCPHRGDVVIDVPKLLIRGEVLIIQRA